ncbi:hydrocephalus-inducing protein homolog [Lycorma delicatula]|uniref:hydrocephalus-inducing protein homolog n=1 Tax=Lycorma delicatula TaxID=130591 RepID=UPI003F519E9E
MIMYVNDTFSYVIAPEYDINFGPMHLSSKKELLIHIANTGVFDFQYTFIDVLNPPDGTLQIEGVKKTGEKGKSKEKTETPGSSKKKKEKNQGVQPLVIGSFTIPKPSGILEPGCSINVPVQCNFPTLGEIIADIRILISESKIKNGIPMKLLAHGSVSQIDFKNTDFIFQDATLCDSTHDLIPFEKIKEETSFYIKNQNKLIFFNTTVGATASLDLHLHNSELLTTGVSCKITSDNSCFSVFPTNENICPYSTKHIKLSFSPVNLEMMNGLLEISAGNTIMTTKLQGEGVFPQIEIINPPNLNQESDNVAFLPTLLNTYSNQELSFKNTGSVTCRKKQVGMQHTTLVVLQPNSVAEFSVMFTPISVKTYRCEIKLHIAGNPYENLSVIFIGCGYMDDVIFDIERLTLKEMAKLMTKESLQELFSQFTVISCYCYNLGYCYISFPKERTLKMLNISATSVYRYEWNEKEGFTISPRMGFIAPGDFAELLINFVSDESKLPDFVVYLICNLTKVEISEGSVTEFENKVTDDQETVITASTDDLLPETVEEVKYKRVEGTWQVILLKVTGVVDLPEPVCNNSTITFDDTLLFESAEYIIDINNSGSVPLMYEWNIRSYIPITVEKKNVWKENCASLLSIGTSRPKSFPKFNAKSVDRPMTAQTIRHRSSTLRGPRPISSSASLITITPNVVTKKDSTSSEHDYEACVFSVSPTRGTIDPLGSEKFVFKFTPLQLLHYTAKFVMMLSHSPLNNNKLIVVEVSGIGIMPLCHFIINETDCLLTRTYQPTMEIEPHTKILEISVLGVGLPITK